MHPWERRLRDLAHLLRNCGDTYFSPDLFRRNTNQFLQTSRTVTFIIQKNKNSIPNFEDWYQQNLLGPWKNDPIMTWAKDARNVIEKEGDLDMQSTLRSSVLYSHLASEDMVIETSKIELHKADIEKLMRLAKSTLPAGILDSALLKIERRWVANSLPDRELVNSLTYAYARLQTLCNALALHLGGELDTSIPHATEMDPLSNDVAKVRIIKFAKAGIGRTRNIRMSADPDFQAPPEFVKLKEDLAKSPKPSSLLEIVSFHSKMAYVTFNYHGNHVQMLALYDKEWKQIDFITTAFSDQADKFVFWRSIADRATYLKAYAIVWTSESWIRDLKGNEGRPIQKLPLVGEQLHVMGASAKEEIEIVAWNISRSTADATPILVPLRPDDTDWPGGTVFFLRPVIEAMNKVHFSKKTSQKS